MTILGKDLVLKENDKYPHIQILLKTQKKDRIGKDEVVDVSGTNNFVCPIKAYKSTKSRHQNYHLLHTNQYFAQKMGKLTLGNSLMQI